MGRVPETSFKFLARLPVCAGTRVPGAAAAPARPRAGRSAAGGPAQRWPRGHGRPRRLGPRLPPVSARTGRGKLSGGTGPAVARGDPAGPSGQRAGALSSLTGKRRRPAASAARATSTGRPRGGAGGRAGACVNTGPRRRPGPGDGRRRGGSPSTPRPPSPGPARGRRAPAASQPPTCSQPPLRAGGAAARSPSPRPPPASPRCRGRRSAGPHRAGPSPLPPGTGGRGAPGAGAPRNPAGEPPGLGSGRGCWARRGTRLSPRAVGSRREFPKVAPVPPSPNAATLPAGASGEGLGGAAWAADPPARQRSGRHRRKPPGAHGARCASVPVPHRHGCAGGERAVGKLFARITNSPCDTVGRDLNFRPVF